MNKKPEDFQPTQQYPIASRVQEWKQNSVYVQAIFFVKKEERKERKIERKKSLGR